MLQGKKKLLKMREVRFINPPAYDEISVKKLYHDVISQGDLKDYFPNQFPKECQCDRAYFWNVWNSKLPEQVKETPRALEPFPKSEPSSLSVRDGQKALSRRSDAWGLRISVRRTDFGKPEI